jgi:glycosyltransferase involved in cell wall biosynthesis
MAKVNPSTPQPEGWGLLRVDPERRFSTPPSKAGLGAVERVKILFLHSSSDLYGSDRCLLNILSNLDRKKFEPLVILPDFGPLYMELEKLGIEPKVMNLGVLRRKFFHPLGMIVYVISCFFGCLKILFYLKRNRIGIVHTNTSATLAGGIVAKFLGIPHLWHLREMIIEPKWLWRLLSTFAFLFSDRVLAVSEGVREHCSKGSFYKRPEKIEVIYDGIDVALFSPTVSGLPFRKEIAVSDGDVLVGTVGRVNPRKGHDRLLEVAKEVICRNGSVVFVIVGDAYRGEEFLFQRLKEKISENTFAGKVILTGFREDVSAIYSAFDIYLHPSLWPESFGLVVAEAMAAGKPVIANNIGGVKEIIVDGQTGFLVNPGDRSQMVEAITELIKDKDLRESMGRAGRKRIIEKFSIDQFKEKMDTLWNSVNSK